jgi:sulfate adenylyltransferase
MTTSGFTVFFTGLPASGKSTTAAALCKGLEERFQCAVSLLDGDALRKTISQDLGFSRADREENIRRAGALAAEITANGGIAVCALIAPYDASRKTARQIVSAAGPFFLVYMSTPVEICEQRDYKGLYGKARAGLIAQFTGISDPYEPPDDAEVVIDATATTPDQAADTIIGYINAAMR